MNPTLEIPKMENEAAPSSIEYDSLFVCFNESNTIVCGKMKTFNYNQLDDNTTVEPFFGEIDLFGF